MDDLERALIPATDQNVESIVRRPNPRITRGLARAVGMTRDKSDLLEVKSTVYEWSRERGSTYFKATLYSSLVWFSLDHLCCDPLGHYILTGDKIYSPDGDLLTSLENNDWVRYWYDDYDDGTSIISMVSAEDSWLLARFSRAFSEDEVIYRANWLFDEIPVTVYVSSEESLSFVVPSGGDIICGLYGGGFLIVSDDREVRYVNTDSVYVSGAIANGYLYAVSESTNSYIHMFDVQDLLAQATVAEGPSNARRPTIQHELQLDGYPLRVTTDGEGIFILKSSVPIPAGDDDQLYNHIEGALEDMDVTVAVALGHQVIGSFKARYRNAQLVPIDLAVSESSIAMFGLQISAEGVTVGLYIADKWQHANHLE